MNFGMQQFRIINCCYRSILLKNQATPSWDKNISLLNRCQTCNLHITLTCHKGHSKWANIKHTKQAKDLEKSQLYQKYARLIRIAAKESGGTDVQINSKLARVIEQAKNLQMPASTIEQNLKSIDKAEENAKPGVVSLVGTGGVLILVDVLTDKLTRTRQQISAIVKKGSLKYEKSDRVESAFDEKGVLVTKGDETNLSKAFEHAIEIGAEDVELEDGFFTFTCSPHDFTNVKKGLQNLNYDIQYADIDKIPNLIATLKESDLEIMKATISKLEQHDDVIRVHTNFDL